MAGRLGIDPRLQPPDDDDDFERFFQQTLESQKNEYVPPAERKDYFDKIGLGQLDGDADLKFELYEAPRSRLESVLQERLKNNNTNLAQPKPGLFSSPIIDLDLAKKGWESTKNSVKSFFGMGQDPQDDPMALTPLGPSPIVGKTDEGRPILRSPSGDIMTERTETFDNPTKPGEYVNAPTLYGGKDIDPSTGKPWNLQDVYRRNDGMDPDTGSPLQSFPGKSEAERAAQARSNELGQKYGHLSQGEPRKPAVKTKMLGTPPEEAQGQSFMDKAFSYLPFGGHLQSGEQQAKRASQEDLMPAPRELYGQSPEIPVPTDLMGQEREPYPSELDFFKSNTKTTGMATEDGKIIINPFSNLSPQERESVKKNEQIRLFLRNNNTDVSFSLTPDQEQRFSGYGSPTDIRHTIIARALSGDPSSGILTEEQQNAIRELQRTINEGTGQSTTNSDPDRQYAEYASPLAAFTATIMDNDRRNAFIDDLKQAGSSVMQGLAQVPSGLFKSIGIAAKAIDDQLPTWLQQHGEQKTEEMATYQLGQSIQDAAAEAFPTDPARQKEFLATVLPQAIGSMLGFMATGGTASALGGSRMAGTVLFGAGAQAPGGYEEAKAAGPQADEETPYSVADVLSPLGAAAKHLGESSADPERNARKSFLLGLGIGATEAIPIERAIRRIDEASGGGLSKVIRSHGEAAAEEWVQEFFQQSAGNAVAQQLYDQDRNVLEGSFDSAAAGGVSGFMMSVVMGMLRAKGGNLGYEPSQPLEPIAQEGTPSLDPMESGLPPEPMASEGVPSPLAPEDLAVPDVAQLPSAVEALQDLPPVDLPQTENNLGAFEGQGMTPFVQGPPQAEALEEEGPITEEQILSALGASFPQESQPKLIKQPKPEETPVTFQTSKGSTYTVNPDGTTTRNKAARPEHPGEQGIQPRSERTVYVTPEDAIALGEVQAMGGPKTKLGFTKDGRIGVQYLEGKDRGKFEGRTVKTFKDNPEVGLMPIEIIEGKTSHFGNAITSLSTNKEAPHATEVPQPATMEKPLGKRAQAKVEQEQKASLASLYDTFRYADAMDDQETMQQVADQLAAQDKELPDPEQFQQWADIRDTLNAAKNSMGIAGKERGFKTLVDVDGQGGTPEIASSKSPTDAWFKELTSKPASSKYLVEGQKAWNKEKIERTIAEGMNLLPGEEPSANLQVLIEAIQQDPKYSQLLVAEPESGYGHDLFGPDQTSLFGEELEVEAQPEAEKAEEPKKEESTKEVATVRGLAKEDYDALKPILERDVSKEITPRKKAMAAANVLDGISPASQQALIDHLKEFDLEAYKGLHEQNIATPHRAIGKTSLPAIEAEKPKPKEADEEYVIPPYDPKKAAKLGLLPKVELQVPAQPKRINKKYNAPQPEPQDDFALTPLAEKPRKAKAAEQPELFGKGEGLETGVAPIIGREATLEEAPLFSKTAQEEQPQQSFMPFGEDNAVREEESPYHDQPIDAMSAERKARARLADIEQSMQRKKPWHDPALLDETVKDVQRVHEPEATYQPKRETQFYSQLQRTLEAKMPNAAPASQVMGILKSGNVKQDELEWSGLQEYLADKPKVTKQEVMEYLQGNQVQIEEKALGKKLTHEDLGWMQRGDTYRPSSRFNVGKVERIPTNGKYRYTGPGGTFEIFNTLGKAKDALLKGARNMGTNGTKFGQYTLPGGTNYQEHLLTLPTSQGTSVKLAEGKYRLWDNKKNDWIRGDDGKIIPGFDNEVRANLEAEKLDGPDRERAFRSSHFDEPNILAHVRANDRTGPNGEKILFVEEVQSDWHQKGKKEGYADPNKKRYAVYDIGPAVPVAKFSTMAEAEYYQKANVPRGHVSTLPPDSGVPSAPFKKTWHELAMKKMLRKAVDEGYDQLSWITGEETAKRYDLEKQLDRVYAEKIRGGSKDGQYEIQAFKKGEEVSPAINRVVSENELPEILGKDLARKIISDASVNQDGKEYSGLDLKIGGEWAKNLYDKMIPQFMQKFTKKWGGKVEVGSIKGDNAPDHVVAQYADQPDHPFTKKQKIPVHTLKITDAMRESVQQEGLPIFEKEQSYEPGVSTAEGRDSGVQRGARGAKESLDAGVTPGRQGTGGRLSTLREGGGVKTHAKRLTAELKKNTRVDLRGAKAETPEDIADLAQIFRSPQYETLRVWYVKDGKVVAHEGLTSRLPNVVAFASNNEGVGKYIDTVKKRMARFKADGYYLQHNHPSGDPSPSDQDVQFTDMMQQEVPGMQGHVIINHKQYAVIAREPEIVGIPIPMEREMRVSKRSIDNKDFRENPEKAHDLLGAKIQNDVDVVNIARAVQAETGYTTVVYAGAKGEVEAIQEVPDAKVLSKDFTGYIRNSTVNFGATSAYTVSTSDATQPDTMELVRRGVLRDAIIDRDGEIQSARDFVKAPPPIANIHQGRSLQQASKQTRRVMEDEAPYKATKQTETEAFKKWFGDSKVVDAQGKPLVVYHGTTYPDIEKFLPDGAGENSGRTLEHFKKAVKENKPYGLMNFRGGTFFSPKPDYAGNYTGENTGSIYPVYIKAENPAFFDMETKEWSGTNSNRTPDALILKIGNDIQEIAIIDPTQIKSAIGNEGTFDPKNPSILKEEEDAYTPSKKFSADAFADLERQDEQINRKEVKAGSQPPAGQPPRGIPQTPAFDGFDVPSESTFERIRRYVQDRFRRLAVVQGAITEQVGAIEEEKDAHLHAELFPGKVEPQIVSLERDHFRPLIKAMHEAKVSKDELDQYVYAKHAPERNAYIASINPAMPDGGSGMTNQEAKDILKAFAAKGQTATMEPLAKRVYAINQKRLDILVDGGLITAGERQVLNDTYDFYVPLKGAPGDQAPSRPRTGKGFDIRGKEHKRALGRKSQAHSILEHVWAQSDEAIIRAEKNIVGQAFLKMAQQYPHKEMWTVNPVKYRKYFDQRTGEVRAGKDPLTTLAENVLSVKVDGKEHYIEIHDEALAQAMKNLGAERSGMILKALQGVNRYLAMVNTALNPEFVLSNFQRDIQTAGVNLAGEQGLKYVAQVMRGVPGAVRGSYGYIANQDSSTEWGKWFKEYEENGGRIGFFGLEDIEVKRNRLSSLIGRLENTPKAKALGLASGLHDLIFDLNGAIENGVRLSAYKHARTMLKMSPKKAASLARNLTVDFNKKGILGNVMNGMYLFFNANLQGTARLARALTNKRVQKIVGGAVAGAFMHAELNRWLAGDDPDDDENYFSKMDDYIQESFIPFFYGDPEGKFAKWQLPYGYNTFYWFGQALNRLAHGEVTPGEFLGGFTRTLLGAFNPLGSDDMLLKNAVPTFARWWVDLELNKNFFGGPIMPEQFPFQPPKPDSELYFRSVSSSSKAIAQGVNRLTGGSQWRPGWADVSPETIDYMVQYFTGGTGATILRSGSLPVKILKGLPIEANDVPFVRKFLGNPSSWKASDRWRTEADDVATVLRQHKDLKKTDPGAALDFAVESAPLLRLERHMKVAQKALSHLGDLRDTAVSMEDEQEVEALRDASERVQKWFHRAYQQAKDGEVVPGLPYDRKDNSYKSQGKRLALRMRVLSSMPATRNGAKQQQPGQAIEQQTRTQFEKGGAQEEDPFLSVMGLGG